MGVNCIMIYCLLPKRVRIDITTQVVVITKTFKIFSQEPIVSIKKQQIYTMVKVIISVCAIMELVHLLVDSKFAAYKKR